MSSNNAHPIKIRSSEHADIDTRPRLIIDTYSIEDISNKYCIDADSDSIVLYKYVPTTTDMYIFSLVDGISLSIKLFDENMNLLSVSKNDDGTFKIRQSLEEGKNYYLSVSSMEEISCDYKIYIETPLFVTIN